MRFGSIDAVIHYNIFSRIISEIPCIFLGLHVVVYFGDFGALIPASVGAKALTTFAHFLPFWALSLMWPSHRWAPGLLSWAWTVPPFAR